MFFLLSMRRPHRSTRTFTLFPYTALFRTIDNGFSSALTPRSTARTMALCLISRSVGGVIILWVKGDGDVRDFSPGSTSFYPVHREGGELIDFGFSGCQHQTAKIREVRRIGRASCRERVCQYV